MSDRDLCWVSSQERAAERRYEEQTEGCPRDHYRCCCGRITPNNEMNFVSPNPWSSPVCGTCFGEWMDEQKGGSDASE